MPAEFTASTFNIDQLIAGNADDLRTEKVTLLAGENRTRGSLLGKITVGAAVGAAVAGNTGNGAIAGVSTGTNGATQPGVYHAICVGPAANGGEFVVEDPQGVIIGRVAVGVAFDNQVGFTINDGAVDFVAGDEFTITVAAGSGKYKLAVAAARDGSQAPCRILAEDCDATAADTDAIVYFTGDFNETQVTFGAGLTADSVRDALRALHLFLTPATAA